MPESPDDSQAHLRAICPGLKVATDYDKDEKEEMADTYTVEHKIRIDAPASAVYERIVDFRRRPASPYEELDPGLLMRAREP